MEKKQPQPLPKAQRKTDPIRNVDEFLKDVAEGKAQIARGEYCTLDELKVYIEAQKQLLRAKKGSKWKLKYLQKHACK